MTLILFNKDAKAFKWISHYCFTIRFECKLSTSTCCFKIIPKNLKNRSKSSQDWLTRHLNDPYVKRAKFEAYRARSAFKLIELDEKYKILQPGLIVLECGAAPGSWTQVIVPRINSLGEMPHRPLGKVIALDLLPFAPIQGAILLPSCDFNSSSTHQLIHEKLQGRKVDLVLSDMAPNATGSRDLDHQCIMNLVTSVLDFALNNSRQGANFLCKIWDGHRMQDFVRKLKELYTTTKIIKPPASRDKSREIYILSRGLK